MPWKEVTLMSQRREFVTLAIQSGCNIKKLCRRFGISRKTGYKWITRFEEYGLSGLEDRSRRPLQSPERSDPDTEAAVLALRTKHPAWGGRKLRARLLALGHEEVPSPSTITAILHRYDCIDPVESAARTSYQRFEHEQPNHLWQMDFKGDFATDSGRCYPLTVLDDHSRYSILLEACSDQRTQTVMKHLVSAFERYGLPYRMLMDNGSPWSGGPGYPYTPLTVWLIRQGISICHSRAYHPQTHGKEERFHRTLEAELIRYRRFIDLADCQEHFISFREVYNHERPHEALGMAVPSSRYSLSPRVYSPELAPIEYGSMDQVRKVQEGGVIHFKGREYTVSKAFAGYPIGIRPTNTDGIFDVYFCHQIISHIDLTVFHSGV